MKEWTKNDVIKTWPKRDKNAYKGTFGKIGVIAGSLYMPGACVLSSKAAVRSGAGLTTINTIKENFPIIGSQLPEAMLYDRNSNLKDFVSGLDSVLIGPGIDAGDKEMLTYLIEQFEGVLVIDAHALRYVKNMYDIIKNREAPIIITPHFGEMATILNNDIQTIIDKQEQVATNVAQEFGVYVVLKGSETIVASPFGEVTVNKTGNTGLSKGGSGDVLAGMIVGFVNRYEKLGDAIRSAVFMHGYTAEYISEKIGVEAMTPGDIVDYLGESMKRIKDSEKDFI